MLRSPPMGGRGGDEKRTKAKGCPTAFRKWCVGQAEMQHKPQNRRRQQEQRHLQEPLTFVPKLMNSTPSVPTIWSAVWHARGSSIIVPIGMSSCGLRGSDDKRDDGMRNGHPLLYPILVVRACGPYPNAAMHARGRVARGPRFEGTHMVTTNTEPPWEGQQKATGKRKKKHERTRCAWNTSETASSTYIRSFFCDSRQLRPSSARRRRRPRSSARSVSAPWPWTRRAP